MTTLWADPGETDREYFDPDPHRHDVEDAPEEPDWMAEVEPWPTNARPSTPARI